LAASYKDLIAWKKAITLVNSIYDMTETFPSKELYGLSNQLRRAAVSVPSNIAEGQTHFTRPEFKRFLRMAKGSLAEIETQVIIAGNREYIQKEALESALKDIDELSRIIAGLISSLGDA
jgi:four helix bundle protein